MSIREDDDEEIIHLPGFWSSVAKFAFALSIPATLSLMTLSAWVISTIFQHDTRITVLERMAMHSLKSNSPGSGNSSATIITGDAAKVASEQAKAKGYLTTEEFAKVIGKDARTVLTYIHEGKIQPAPVQDGREWRIAVDSRLQPQLAANSGKEATDEP
jgi:hypothetical protein